MARSVLFPKSVGWRIVLAIILICTVPVLGRVVRDLLSGPWHIQISYRGSLNDSSRFLARNTGQSAQFVRITRFALSTAELGNLNSDEFESKIKDAGRLIPPAAIAEFTVNAPSDTETYLCSSLRAIGFFAQYGTLEKGRLKSSEEPISLRTQKMLGDLSCWFGMSNRSISHKHVDEERISVPCAQVNWVSGCISQLMPPDE